MRPSQAMMESMFSQRNIHDVLHRSIRYQLDKVLLTWSIGAFMRLNAYLSGDYYPSKNGRIQDLAFYLADGNAEDLIISVLVAVIRAKRDQTIQQVVGYLESSMPHEDKWERIRTAAELVAILGGKGRLFEIVREDNEDWPIVRVNFWPVLMDTFHDQLAWIEDTHFNPPLVERPRKVKNNYDAGYHTVTEPMVLGRETRHNKRLNLDVINTLNKIEWRLDPDVLAHPERPPKPIEDPQQMENYVRHVQQSRRIYDIIGEEAFWMIWQFDSRGRIYSHGHHINFQSHEYKKVMLNFGPKREVTR